MKSVAANAESKIRELQSSLRDAETRLVRLFDDRSRDLMRRASHLADEASLNARKTREDAKMRIREKPIEAVAIGLGIGLFLGIVVGVSMTCARRPETEEPFIEE